MKSLKADLYVSGMNGERALSRLRRGGIPVLRAEKRAKNLLIARIYRKDLKKAFTILGRSCYNIAKVRPVGVYAAIACALKNISFIACAAAFVIGAAASDGLILSVSYTGSGAYYKAEAADILNGLGIGPFKSLSGADVPMAISAILSLRDVSFCSIERSGYILKVDIEVSPSAVGADEGALVCDRAGVVRSVIVLSGTALVSEDDGVKDGDELVVPYTVGADGVKRKCMAAARVLVECGVSAEGLSAEGAIKSAELLADGEIVNSYAEFTGDAYKATAIYLKTFSINM